MNKRMSKLLRVVVFAGLTFLAPIATATIPNTINYQGYLTSGLGVPVNIGVPMTFRLYSAATGGSALWSETWGSIPVNNGNFTAALGSITPINLNFDVPYWLTIEVGTDGEMAPRLAMSTIPYAAVAAGLDSTADVPGAQVSGAISNATIAGNHITGTINATTAVTATNLSGNIAGNQITGDIVAQGNFVLPNSTATTGNVIKNGSRFMHNTGSQNTFMGESAGNFTLSGPGDNTGAGTFALTAITNGFGNTAAGSRTLISNTTGYQNSALGSTALRLNVDGYDNTALGSGAMSGMVSGNGNTAGGVNSLASNVSGISNTALGYHALQNATGSKNIAIGTDAGSVVTTGTRNIHIGHVGNASDTNVIRIGLTGDQTATFIAAIGGNNVTGVPVLIDANGQLGVGTSSRAGKDDIADMGNASDVLMRLRPVTFHYKSGTAADASRQQYGLIAEEVAQVAPDLAAHSADGKIETVYYQHLSPMLLNEYQKQQRTIQKQAAELARQRTRMEMLEHELQEIKRLLGAR